MGGVGCLSVCVWLCVIVCGCVCVCVCVCEGVCGCVCGGGGGSVVVCGVVDDCVGRRVCKNEDM